MIKTRLLGGDVCDWRSEATTVRWTVADDPAQHAAQDNAWRSRVGRRQGSKKEWQQQGDWQVTLVGTQTEPLLQQEAASTSANTGRYLSPRSGRSRLSPPIRKDGVFWWRQEKGESKDQIVALMIYACGV